MSHYHIKFEPLGRRGEFLEKASLLDCARQLGVGIVSICGGKGECLRCKVQVIRGAVTEPIALERKIFSPQELEAGFRLACQTRPESDMTLAVPPESMTTSQRAQVEGMEVSVEPESLVRAYDVQLQPPSLPDQRADAERLAEGLEQQHHTRYGTIDTEVLRNISAVLRACDWEVQVSLRNDEVVALSPQGKRQLGLAVDLGTTKIAGYLMDLNSGQTLINKGLMNPQIAYGEDIMSRMARTRKSPNEVARLQHLVIEALNQLALVLCAKVGAKPQQIVEAVVAGNTVMHHLLLSLPVEQLGLSPYVPVISNAVDVKAREIGLHIAPGAYLHLLPNIAGYVGGDHVAMLLSTEIWKSEKVVIGLDIGTNTEVCLVKDGELTCLSCPSGPAYEGGHIKHGMRAADNAIEHLRIVGDKVEFQTIGGTPPAGLCGSGILDAVAQLYLAGVIDDNGRISLNHPRAHENHGCREFVLVSEEERDGNAAITITQKDIRELQLAKGAIRSAIQVLLETKEISPDEVQKVIIAGAFGTYIDVASAVTIGMFPPLPLNLFQQIGNAAGIGAKLVLISQRKRADAQTIARQAFYIELSNTPNFTHTFAQANYIGLFHLEDGERKEISR